MKISPDKKAILLVVVAVAAILVVLFVSPPTTFSIPLSKEEAVEISKKSMLVKEGLAIAGSFTIETGYYNSSMLEQLREWHSDKTFKNAPKDAFWEEKVPAGHSVWQLIWWFRYPGLGGYNVIVIVDAETASIIYETKGIEILSE